MHHNITSLCSTNIFFNALWIYLDRVFPPKHSDGFPVFPCWLFVKYRHLRWNFMRHVKTRIFQIEVWAVRVKFPRAAVPPRPEWHWSCHGLLPPCEFCCINSACVPHVIMARRCALHRVFSLLGFKRDEPFSCLKEFIWDAVGWLARCGTTMKVN